LAVVGPIPGHQAIAKHREEELTLVEAVQIRKARKAPETIELLGCPQIDEAIVLALRRVEARQHPDRADQAVGVAPGRVKTALCFS
jgi:hypothetical protein